MKKRWRNEKVCAFRIWRADGSSSLLCQWEDVRGKSAHHKSVQNHVTHNIVAVCKWSALNLQAMTTRNSESNSYEPISRCQCYAYARSKNANSEATSESAFQNELLRPHLAGVMLGDCAPYAPAKSSCPS